MKRLMVSALGNRIYLTSVKEVKGKPGIFLATGNKEDYTDEAIRAVFEWFMNNHKENEPAEAYEIKFPGSGYKLIMVKEEAQENREMIFAEYWVAKECKDPHYGMCYHCGKCGRVFRDGIMVDDGGTTEDVDD